MTHLNLTSYEGVERLEQFSEETFASYCRAKLASCDKHVSFVRNHCMKSVGPLRICEVGSGSGKLLYRLEREGLLESGIGYEVSSSRCLFAKEFGRFCQSQNVTTLNENFLGASLPENSFDLIIGVDVVLNLIGAISPETTEFFLDKSMRALRAGGSLVLEVMTCARELEFVLKSPDGHYRTWKRFPDSDPFSIGLDQMSLTQDGNLLWEKSFIARTGGEGSPFVNELKPFDLDFFARYSLTKNFVVDFFPHWAELDDTADQEFVVLITKGVAEKSP